MGQTHLLPFGVATLVASLFGAAALAHPVSSPANLYSGPGAKWPVIADIPAGGEVNVINCGPGWSRDWCHVSYGGKKGYVVAATLAPSGNDVIVAPIVTTDLANVRKGPGAKWAVVGVLQPDTTVNVSYCVNGWLNGWCRVHYEDKTGYVRGALLKRQGALFSP